MTVVAVSVRMEGAALIRWMGLTVPVRLDTPDYSVKQVTHIVQHYVLYIGVQNIGKLLRNAKSGNTICEYQEVNLTNIKYYRI